MTEKWETICCYVCVDIISLLSLLPRLKDRVVSQAVKQWTVLCHAKSKSSKKVRRGEEEFLRPHPSPPVNPPSPLLSFLLASL